MGNRLRITVPRSRFDGLVRTATATSPADRPSGLDTAVELKCPEKASTQRLCLGEPFGET
jgi:hypothetical protein